MCGMKGKSVVGLLIPMCTGCASSAVCKQAVDEQKKPESHQLSEKGFVFFLSFFFWTLIKAENGGVFSFVCCSFCPVIHSS